MRDDPAGGKVGQDQTTMEDWITIWESELQALSGDREMREAPAAAATLWAAMARDAAAWLEQWRPFTDVASGGVPWTGTEARAAATAAAPDARDEAFALLAERVAALERLVAAASSGGADN